MIDEKPFVVGIAGGSASGKSTLCEALVSALEQLRVKVFHMDEYFFPTDRRPRAKGPVSETIYLDDNHPKTMDLARLRDDIVAALNERAAQVVIVEGLLTLQNDDIYALLDLKLFVDCPADARIVRRLRRNMGRGLSFEEISSVYLDLVRFRHDEYIEPNKWRADVFLNGYHPSQAALRMIVDTILLSQTGRDIVSLPKG